jgi:hypothetical protein
MVRYSLFDERSEPGGERQLVKTRCLFCSRREKEIDLSK